ncbi:MAG: hypothetical protein JNK60_09510, partial [Acidobacteria bacterium]|nr:hypothetical protein [Acidobacteriota bacterium]
FETAETRWLGLQTAIGTSGAFAFEIDDVALVGARAPGAPHGGATQSRVKRTPASAVAGARWEPLGTDPAGDGTKALLPDAVSLGSWTSGSTVWFRVGLAAPMGEDFGVNLVLDLDGDPANGEPWWGKNTAFRFDLLVSAWAFASSSSTLDGAIGIARAGDAVKGSVIDESLGAPRIVAAPGGKEIYIGVPSALLGAAAPIRVVAAVGSTFLHNDDLPDSGAAQLARLP